MLLFNIGQIDRPPAGGSTPAPGAINSLRPRRRPEIRAVVERYLRLHLDANLDRPQTVRHARDALRRLVQWLAATHPEITNLAELHREHAEEFLRWLGEQTSQHTGVPLAMTTRRSVVTLLTRFVNETAAWQWDDVPGPGAVHPRGHPEDPQVAAAVHPRPRTRRADDRSRRNCPTPTSGQR